MATETKARWESQTENAGGGDGAVGGRAEPVLEEEDILKDR